MPRRLKNALDGRCQRNTTAPQAISQLMTVSSLARPMPGWVLPSTASTLSVWIPNRIVPVTRAHLLPFWQARAIQSHTAISITRQQYDQRRHRGQAGMARVSDRFFRMMPMTIRRKPIA